MSLDYARTVLRAEVAAVESVLDRLGASFVEALDLVAARPDARVVACGIGKAGLIAQKAAATLSSTGTASFFLHPADALHGDLGMTRAGDVALVFSNSGESEEIGRLLPYLRRLELAVVAITGSPRSTLGVQSDIVLELGDLKEACPLGLAPTASTTAMLALADAFAMALMRRRGFTADRYAAYHPAGELGRRALTVAEVMRRDEAAALLGPGTPVREALQRISTARAGAAAVVDADGGLLGVFTDGDLRRRLLDAPDLLDRPVGEAMTASPSSVRADAPAAQALAILRERRIGEAPVLDADGRVVGVIDLKGLLAAGVT